MFLTLFTISVGGSFIQEHFNHHISEMSIKTLMINKTEHVQLLFLILTNIHFYIKYSLCTLSLFLLSILPTKAYPAFQITITVK